MGVIDVATVARGNTDSETGGVDRRVGRAADGGCGAHLGGKEQNLLLQKKKF